MPDNPPLPLEYQIYDPDRKVITVQVVAPYRRPYWLHILLFLLTILSTLCVGAVLQRNFLNGTAPLTMDQDFFEPFTWTLSNWRRLAMGVPFSLSLLGILTAHEMGHYLLCVRWRTLASWPYFIPAPNLIGTFGAFIRIRAPFRSRQELFDVGIAGPLAGFAVAVPVLFAGLMASKFSSHPPDDGAITLGLPLIFRLAHWILAALGSHTPAAQAGLSQLLLHPMAIAAWVGMFATSLNLLPGGQLDGGHIIYALRPQAHWLVSRLTIVAMLPLGWFYWAAWVVWAIVLRITRRHPEIEDQTPPDRGRKILALVALCILVLTFHWDPLPGASLRNVANEIAGHFSKK
jgi:membrane-associated protease RseP (regulator of RpoE activity)